MTPDSQDPGPEVAGQAPRPARAPRRKPSTPTDAQGPDTTAAPTRTGASAPRPVRARRAGVEEPTPPARIPRRRTGRTAGPRVLVRVVREVRPPTAPATTPVAASVPATVPRAAPVVRPAQVQVFEDHDLPAETRAKVWEDLVDWVIWVHDAYELSREEALPPCWPDHPGLVRELAALRAWRVEIYLPYPTPPTDPEAPAPAPVPNGGAARGWHAELRNVLAATKRMYAPGCRAGHHDAPTSWSKDGDQRAAWLAARPTVLSMRRHRLPWPGPGPAGPSPAGPTGRPGAPLVMADAHMQAARAAGHTTSAGAHTDAYLRHHDTWWARRPEGDWAAITDTVLAARLDRAATASATAEAAVHDTRPLTR